MMSDCLKLIFRSIFAHNHTHVMVKIGETLNLYMSNAVAQCSTEEPEATLCKGAVQVVILIRL